MTARSLVRGAIWNQAGLALPVLAALWAVPQLVSALGVERFGILSLAWMLIGYFTLFDLGVSGALTRLVSERMATRRGDEVPALVGTALALTAGMGVVGAAVVTAAAPWVVRSGLHMPEALRDESLGLMWVLAATLPIVTTTAALAGVLTAQRRFGVLNAIRVPMGILTYVGPLLVAPFAPGLVPVGLTLAAIRVAGALAHLAACWVGTPELRSGFRVSPTLLRPILSFGGWMTVTAVVGPLMVSMDRFLIGGMLSVAMVAYYTTPYDLTTRIGILSMPIVNVMFPAFSASSASDPARTGRLFDWAVRGVIVSTFPFVLILGTFAGEILNAWIGPEFATHGATVLRWLAAGMFLNAMAQVALVLVQGSGRPDLGARLHLAELPFYAAAVWWLIRTRGIEGAAIAWFARVAVDALALFVLAGRARTEQTAGSRTAAFAACVGLLLIVAGNSIPPLSARIGFVAIVLLVFALAAWRLVVIPGRQALGILGRPARA